MRAPAAVLCVLLACLGLASADNPLVKQVKATATKDGVAGTYEGTLKIDKAVLQGNLIHFTGSLTKGQVTWPGKQPEDVQDFVFSQTSGSRKLLQGAQLPVLNSITGSCQILHLTLGPLNLDLLGLVVHLDTVNLDITAQTGPGNLLGNLLCSIAGLLNGNGLNVTPLLRALNNVLTSLTSALG